ncbi:uncharacterized protein EKO05_0002751 [Ascochyta rabiei]|uniref:Uncharacterized protein n=1 Tax=Didymella rabiei TaxID=5454 RepID=A0A162YQN6_DIDRA|nr:uncharacterized protein EKO05_0002751 [Ascochyta rabiei]KZM20172.1 hypothetical protein ST47_g8731 [Ascochyta rabiei]UPX12187.1 hypothetical protein EKO05_0002751 [Ascochyta rabiei]
MPLDQLPEELLLQVALYLPDSATPKHLKNLCLTSSALRPIAQEALHTTARLAISCGCHPKVNAVAKILRTLLDRPDLASKVKTLRFRAVRKGVEKVYVEHGFEFLDFRARCISKLDELGYRSAHLWRRSIDNSIESAFGGLLLALLPNLTDLDFWIKDHQRGPPSSECISGLWGGTSPPDAILHGWRNISHLVTGDTSLLKCGIEFDKLTSLDLRTISIGTVLRLNGPGSLQGAENLIDLNLTVSIQFADRPLVEKAEIEFSELLEALACRALKNLKILFINDGYHIGDDLTTELNTGYFLDQLRCFEKTLEYLSITLEAADDDGELEWLMDMCQHPTTSLKDFTVLKSLVIPQPFIFTARSSNWSPEGSCQPRNLPPNLEQLELLYPHEDVEEWVEGFLDVNFYATSSDAPTHSSDAQRRTSTFKKLILICRDDAGISASYFTEGVDKIWWTLSNNNSIETEAYDQLRETRENLACLYEDENLEREDTADEDHEIDEDDEMDDGWEDDDDDDDFNAGLLSSVIGPISPFLEDQTSLLRHLRALPKPEGHAPSEICASLRMSFERVTEAASVLQQDGNIRFEGNFPHSHTYHFVGESEQLLREDRVYRLSEALKRGREPRGSSKADADGWETDESMPELETYDSEPFADAVRDTTNIASREHSGVVVTPTAVLRCLRDMTDPSEGVYQWEISRLLGIDDDNADEVGSALRQLILDGHVHNTRFEDKVYFCNENAELRAEDVE